jgi:hypothetical protein
MSEPSHPLPAPRPGLYRHYKGKEYQVLGLAHHTETMAPLVVYQALYGERGWWVRPHAMFCETVVVNGEVVPRFALVRADE